MSICSHLPVNPSSDIEIIEKRNDWLLFLSKNYSSIVSLLTKYETYLTAVDEIARCISVLGNIEEEMEMLTSVKVERISTFLPQNLPLYSLLLFSIIPGFMAEEISVRCPILMRTVMEQLLKLFPPHLLTNLKLLNISRHDFVHNYVIYSEIVIFNGKYENALKVAAYAPVDGLFIYNGAGVNPFIIGEHADIEFAVEKSVCARLYNSGQDCAGPDAFFVHHSSRNAYLKCLVERLSKLNVGSNNRIDTMVGPLIEKKIFDQTTDLLFQQRKKIYFGGSIDKQNLLIYPTVIFLDSVQACLPEFELFAPIFNVSEYKNEDELCTFFQSDGYLDYEMYISVFGKINIENICPNSIILRNTNILDIEQGNKPFGGYGRKSSFVKIEHSIQSRPILISREINKFKSLTKKDFY